MKLGVDGWATLYKVWPMSDLSQERLRPTLWRTCRVLANRGRLRALRTLLEFPDQPVSVVAKKLSVSVTLTSQYLRALNARGLLSVRRVGRWVYYRPSPDKTIPDAKALLEAIRREFGAEKKPIETIFRSATAFTHPRREEIFRAFHGQALTLPQLREKIGISTKALRRHLRKLQAREFLVAEGEIYRCVEPESHVGKALLKIVSARGED